MKKNCRDPLVEIYYVVKKLYGLSDIFETLQRPSNFFFKYKVL